MNYQVKALLSVGFMNHSAMKANWEVEVQLYAFLKLAPGRGELSASKHQLLYSQGQCSKYHEQEAGEATEPGRMVRRRGKPMPLPGVKF
jgi:hypothetical protein